MGDSKDRGDQPNSRNTAVSVLSQPNEATAINAKQTYFKDHSIPIPESEKVRLHNTPCFIVIISV